MSASETQSEWARPSAFAGVSMRELLAAGEAARVVSTPPRDAEAPPVEQERKAA